MSHGQWWIKVLCQLVTSDVTFGSTNRGADAEVRNLRVLIG